MSGPAPSMDTKGADFARKPVFHCGLASARVLFYRKKAVFWSKNARLSLRSHLRRTSLRSGTARGPGPMCRAAGPKETACRSMRQGLQRLFGAAGVRISADLMRPFRPCGRDKDNAMPSKGSDNGSGKVAEGQGKAAERSSKGSGKVDEKHGLRRTIRKPVASPPPIIEQRSTVVRSPSTCSATLWLPPTLPVLWTVMSTSRKSSGTTRT